MIETDANLAKIKALFDILTECARLDVLNLVRDMVYGTSPLMSKYGWSRLVWQLAWIIEDAYWNSINLIMPENDLPLGTMSMTNYMVWWQLSDKFHEYIRPCEVMSKLICHASRLKGDDCRLKGLPVSYRVWSNCDLYLEENVNHILMQCPLNHVDMSSLLDELYVKFPNVSRALKNEPDKCLMWLLGRPIP